MICISENYRPISIMPFVAKIFELTIKTISNQIIKYHSNHSVFNLVTSSVEHFKRSEHVNRVRFVKKCHCFELILQIPFRIQRKITTLIHCATRVHSGASDIYLLYELFIASNMTYVYCTQMIQLSLCVLVIVSA